jgi:hypothetical protein
MNDAISGMKSLEQIPIHHPRPHHKPGGTGKKDWKIEKNELKNRRLAFGLQPGRRFRLKPELQRSRRTADDQC